VTNLAPHALDVPRRDWRSDQRRLAVAPCMIEAGWGRVINVSSNAGIGTALPGTTFYAATKAAVLSLTRRLAFELGAHGITVDRVLPGFIRTDMTTAHLSPYGVAGVTGALYQRSVLGRGVGEPGKSPTSSNPRARRGRAS